LISGPVDLDDPAGVTVKHVESARDMRTGWKPRFRVDIAIFAAAVATGALPMQAKQKLKKKLGGHAPLQLVENPDILATISETGQEPASGSGVGFGRRDENLIDNARQNSRASCDWIVANDVSPASGVMGGDRNTVHLLARDDARNYCRLLAVMSKSKLRPHWWRESPAPRSRNPRRIHREHGCESRYPAIAAW